MMDGDFAQMYKSLGDLRQACQQSSLFLPENVYDASTEMLVALSASDGNEEVALKLLMSKLKQRNKREHAAITKAGKTEQTECSNNNGNEGKMPVNSEEEDVDNEGNEPEDPVNDEEKEPRRKMSRLTADVRKKLAAVESNKVVVNVLADYGEQHLRQGHTGKGVAQLRAARAIRDYPHAITSATEARAVRSVGPKLAAQIEHILSAEELDKEPISKAFEKYELPKLVQEIQDNKATCPENQALVDELAYFGEHELFFRSGSKGMTHLRAARALQLTDQIITSGSQARLALHRVLGLAITDKIDQILKYGRIVKDVVVAPIVEDLRLNCAIQAENQPLVDTLTNYGSSHLKSGHAGKAAAHLRAAKAIRDSDLVVTSGAHAMASIKYANATVAAKIDQVLKQDHVNTEEDDDSHDELESEFGACEPQDTPVMVHKVYSKQALDEKNQDIVPALSTQEETQLAEWHTGQTTVLMRAAHRLRDAAEVVTSGTVAKALGCIGDKVGAFIDVITMEDTAADSTEE